MAPKTRSSTRKRKASKDSQPNTRSLPRTRRQPRAPRTENRSIESHQESTESASDLPRGPEANFDLNTTSDTELGIDRQETTPSQGPPLSARERRPTDKTFRLRGIPKEWDKAEVQRRVKDRLSLGDNEAVVVRSLSKNPYRHEERVATIEFPRNALTELGDNAKSELGIMIEGHRLLLDTNFFGMTPLHGADDSSCDVDVIALSGLNGHAFGSFKSKSNEPTYMWLRDSLPSDIPRARIFIYGYDTQTTNSDCFQNIGDIGQQLKADLVLMRKTTESSKRHLILIGHSLGGIIIKSAINKMSNGVENEQHIAKSICSVLFFGVPNQGMDITSLIPMVGNRPNRELLQSLGMESEVLQNLSQSFQTSLDSQHSMVFSFYETKESPTAKNVDGQWTMSGPSTVLVDRRSATNGRHWGQEGDYLYPVNRTHSEMVKLDSTHDSVYAQALLCLEGYQESSKTSSTGLSKDQQDCLKSLSFPEKTLRLDDIHTATNTCNWLLQHESYQAWINDPSRLLWIEGAPGVGKSVLMKHALQVLDEKFSKDGYLLLSFFVHGQGSVLQRSKLGLLRAILHQLLRQKPDVFSLVLPKYVERCQTMESWQWSERELQTLLQQCLESACQSTHAILLVDALDELSENIAREVVEYFQYLIDSRSNDASNLRICFSCRHYPTISFDDGHRICVEKENSGDIHYVVRSKLAEVTDFDTILSLITENANGVFQWAVLVSYEAQKLSMEHRMPEHIRQKIQDLPKSLHDLYSGLLRDAPQVTLRFFQWICFAREKLDVQTLRQALSVSIEQSYSSLRQYEEALGFENSEKGISSMVKTLSRGLAKVTNNFSGLQVSLIHQSVSDFLMSVGFQYLEKSLKPDKLERISHIHLSEACFKYLATQKFPTYTNERGNLAIVRYLQDEMVQSWRMPYRGVENVIGYRPRRYGIDKTIDELPSLNEGFCRYAFFHGLPHSLMAKDPKYFPEFLLQFFKRPAKHQYRRSLGFVRAGNSYKDQIKALDRIDQYLRYAYGFQHSLAVAAFFVNNHARISLEFFLEHDHSPDSLSFHGHPYLSVDLIDRRLEAAGLLLETARLDVSAESQYGETILIRAVQDKQLELVDAIISSPKADPDHKDGFGRTPLSYAAENGSSRVVKALLGVSGIDQDSRDKQGRSPLLYAAKSGSLEIVEDLIHFPQIDPNSQDTYGRVPLSYASQNRYLRIVQTLLESSKVDPDIQDYEGRTPLSYGSQSGSLEIVQALLASSKVNSDCQDCQGRTILSYASQNGSLRIVQALLASSKGNPDSQDCRGRTPLSYAAEKGHNEVASYLLRKHRCNPAKRDKSGRTPFSYVTNDSTRRVLDYADKLEVVRNEQKKWREKRNEERRKRVRYS